MSGKKIALVAVPIVVAAVALAAVFASATPQRTETDETKDNGNIVAASSVEDCSAISRRVESILSYGIGQPTDETRNASDRLVEQYCQRPSLIQEIGAMSNSALGLVSYACDAGSDKIKDAGLQTALAEYIQTYCDTSLVVILEDAELLLVTSADYRDSLLNQEETGEDPDIGTNSTVNVDEAKAKLQQATGLANKAKSLAYDGQHYEAARSLDSGVKMVDSLSQK